MGSTAITPQGVFWSLPLLKKQNRFPIKQCRHADATWLPTDTKREERISHDFVLVDNSIVCTMINPLLFPFFCIISNNSSHFRFGPFSSLPQCILDHPPQIKHCRQQKAPTTHHLDRSLSTNRLSNNKCHLLLLHILITTLYYDDGKTVFAK